MVGACSVTFLSLSATRRCNSGGAVDARPGHVAVVGGVPRFHADRRTAGRYRRRRHRRPLRPRSGRSSRPWPPPATGEVARFADRERLDQAETPGGSGGTCPFLPWRGVGSSVPVVLYLVRHGRTEANASGACSAGWTCLSTSWAAGRPRPSDGCRSLREAARVVTSPLTRAVETAERSGPPVSVD